MPAAHKIGADYPGKRLNEVVFPGAHDAGTNDRGLGKNVRTQGFGILGQAERGVRYFDVRVGWQKVGKGGAATFQATTYHGKVQHDIPTKHQHGAEASGRLKGKKKYGGWGDTLDTILNEAKSFVRANGTEFLILRFSKSGDYARIARECINKLGTFHHKGRVNLNIQTLDSLKGKVITVFAKDAYSALNPMRATLPGGSLSSNGLYFVFELLDKKSNTSKGYNGDLVGLQYFGGHSDTNSVDTNTEKQTARMRAPVAADALGMMYWTLTGLSPFDGIRKRNRKLWTGSGRSALERVWQAGMKRQIEDRMGRAAKQPWTAHLFMPNIVMLDFACTSRCHDIFSLNSESATAVERLWRQLPAEDE